MLMRLGQGLSLLLLVIASITGHAAGGVAVSVQGADGDYAGRFATALAEVLPEGIRLVPPAESDVLVALDESSFQAAVDNGRAVIGVGVSRQLALAARQSGCRCSALFAGADPRRQLRLIHELLPAARQVGVVTSDASIWTEKLLAEAAGSLKLELDIVRVPGFEEMGPTLGRLLPRVDVLLAVQDETLYTPATAKLVLLTSYRQNRPVIGPNEQYVRAGSLATSFSSGFDLVETVAAWLRDYQSGDKLPAPAWPMEFSVSLNEHVARAYQVPAREPRWLTARIREGEKP
jgi:putative ABC transport system substrate-binding protein